MAQPTFDDLAASRREWIESVLKPWCRQAALKDLVRAEAEWQDIAGRADAKATLWTWAWSRFPALVHEKMAGVDEAHEVRVTLKNGAAHDGYPDNRKTDRGRLVLVPTGRDSRKGAGAPGPLSIDEIDTVQRIDPPV